ncbi:hypothetical protein SELMODRAFT_405212 [Selaginella moellendorffii]|uniref:Sas10 C-terminal domain-containing protein n=1 Tax=Selaginella moellendorffii TaxID=88036 RepID=D8QWL9_SELML|nr:something about silencing protein 10 [Selaginella moellendorffii]XP_024520643.1 something about silencing protein 10 [Selaginella moellendorffii]EFJ35661.1 hypothetical protein SELMODRAFT_405212 [Selaginella moellendorffii]|eukprot:XP_002963790.1 something about silencing protein 10 [Selaginella moellendorffii]
MGRLKKSRSKALIKEKTKPKNVVRDASDESMDDEIDKFHSNRDKIPLEETDSEEEELENPVLDLEENESEDDGDEEESDEDLPEEEIDDMAAKIERQAKFLRQRTGILHDEDDEESEEEDADKEKLDWGKRKRDYYAADNIDYEIQSSDEEGPALEEAEARRIQKKLAESLRPEDFDQDTEENLDGEADTLEEDVEHSVPIEMEKVRKDLNSLSKDEKLRVVMSNAPELVGLQAELKEALYELEHKVQPLLKKIEIGKVAKELKSYAELKHMLLLSYCQSIVFYLLLKAEGRSVCDHPVIARLVEIRMLLEKVHSLDKKLQPQVDRFVSIDPDLLNAPKHIEKDLNSIPIGEIPILEKQQPVTSTSASDKSGQLIGEESKSMLREMKRLEEKAKRDSLLEPARIPDSKSKKSKKRHGGLLDDLGDDYGTNADLQPKKMLQVIAEAGKRQKKPKINSGDVDLPVKEDLGERRRKREQHILNRSEPPEDGQNEEDHKQFEDEFYKETKERKLAKKAAKAAEVSKNPVVKAEEETYTGKRLITEEMVKNRGLTPYRKKLSKNPRKKYKMKHGKAVTRRKGQVRAIREGKGPYGGEPTGIRTNLSRSIRFG